MYLFIQGRFSTDKGKIVHDVQDFQYYPISPELEGAAIGMKVPGVQSILHLFANAPVTWLFLHHNLSDLILGVFSLVTPPMLCHAVKLSEMELFLGLRIHPRTNMFIWG